MSWKRRKIKHFVEIFVTFSLFECVYIYVYVMGVGSVLPPSGSWELNSDHKAWQKALSPGEPSH